MTGGDVGEGLLRDLAPQVLAALVRRYGHFGVAEDAVQEALIAAAQQWPDRGLPSHPKGWLITVASRRLTDQLRSEESRRLREEAAAEPGPPATAPPADEPAGDRDDTLTLLFLCCHRELSPPSQLAVVLHVLYLMFNEGYAATSGPDASRPELTAEAIRLTRAVHRSLPDDAEVAGLLALMLLTEARHPARTAADGSLVPLAEQDRSLWRADLIAQGTGLVSGALARGPLGPYQLQAAIAAVHAEAPDGAHTDWRQDTTASPGSAPTSTSWPASGRTPWPTTGSRRSAPPACPSAVT